MGSPAVVRCTCTDWPDFSFPEPVEGPARTCVTAMDRVRDVCSTGIGLRKAAGLRVRLPLSSLTVVADDAEQLATFAALIRDELNVRNVVLTSLATAEGEAFGVRQTLQVNARVAGPSAGPRRADGDQGQQEWRLVGVRRGRGHRRRRRTRRG